jgi:hypothetical protein
MKLTKKQYQYLVKLSEAFNASKIATFCPNSEVLVKPGDEIDKNTYLIRFFADPDDSDDWANDLLIMGDYGITWEPWRAYPTEPIGELIEELVIDLDLMIKLAVGQHVSESELS